MAVATQIKRVVLVTIVLSVACRAEFRLGIENIDAKTLSTLAHKRVGLIAHQASCTQSGKRTLDVLLEHGVRVAVIGAPEHGFQANIAAGKKVPHAKDQKTGIEVVSLYESGDKQKKVNDAFLSRCDTLVFDLRDSGMRHYTYISTLLMVLEAAAQTRKPIFIFDSPNPLGGVMEGPVVDADILRLHSFVACASIPLRHGMTMGELARFFNTQVLKKPATLHVVPMRDYDRFVSPSWFGKALSPNIRTAASSQGYSFLGLLGEIKPIRVGIELKKPFQMILLPDAIKLPRVKWQILAQKLDDFGIHAYWFDGADDNSRRYHGLSLRFGSVAHKPLFGAFLTVAEFMQKNGVRCTFAPIFDRAAGTAMVRECLSGNTSKARLVARINGSLETFGKKAMPYFLYTPHPERAYLTV